MSSEPSTRVGFKDTPIATANEESPGFGEYTQALSHFVRRLNRGPLDELRL